MWVTGCQCLIDSSLILRRSEQWREDRESHCLWVTHMVSGQPDLPGPKIRRQWNAVLKDTQRINKISFSTTAFSKVNADICSLQSPLILHYFRPCTYVRELHRNLLHNLTAHDRTVQMLHAAPDRRVVFRASCCISMSQLFIFVFFFALYYF